MKQLYLKYKIEIWVAIAILMVMFLPYQIISSGLIKSDDTLQMIDTATKLLSPIIIGALVFIIVFKAIKKNREED